MNLRAILCVEFCRRWFSCGFVSCVCVFLRVKVEKKKCEERSRSGRNIWENNGTGNGMKHCSIRKTTVLSIVAP